MRDGSWTVDADFSGEALARWLRGVQSAPWSDVKSWIASGKVFVDGVVETNAGRRLRGGEAVELRMAARRKPQQGKLSVTIVHEDRHVLIIEKPPGVSSVPFEKREGGTAMDLVREAWRLRRDHATTVPIYVVHRIDRATSGLLAFALTRAAEHGLSKQFREHTVDRKYLCVAHGHVQSARIESQLVSDRGDRLRGSTRDPKRGKRAVTHVRAIRRLRDATLCEVQLETGRTHQIRIHLSERGHPLVGDKVYTRDRLRDGGALLPSSRLLLHAATLALVHPVSGERLDYSSPIPADMQRVIDALALPGA